MSGINHFKNQTLTFIYRYKDIFFYWMLRFYLEGCKSVLDVGCGNNSPLKRAGKFYSEGIDIFEEGIKESKKKKIHNSYRIADIRDLRKFYKLKSFDAVIALDVIEHLTKKEGFKLLRDIEKIASKKVIVLTPTGFCGRKSQDDNPYQVHKSGWEASDFIKIGYKVRGLRGPKWLRGQNATIRFKPWLFWGIPVYLLEPLLFFFPKYSFDLFAVKELG